MGHPVYIPKSISAIPNKFPSPQFAGSFWTRSYYQEGHYVNVIGQSVEEAAYEGEGYLNVKELDVSCAEGEFQGLIQEFGIEDKIRYGNV